MKVLLRLLLAAVVLVGGFELALRAFPELLPPAYRARFPMHGVEFFDRDLFDRLPVEGVPLPLVVAEHTGPPPADLKEMGVAPADEPTDARDYPALHMPLDELGLCNPGRPERADLVLVGDSFIVSAGVEDPPGLRAQLARATGLSVYSAGIAGLGPVQEAWVTEHVALPLEPRCVILFFFGGNDVIDAAVPAMHRARGATTWREAYADRALPRLWSLDLVRSAFFAPANEVTRGEPLPPLRFVGSGANEPRSVWLHPGQLRDLMWTTQEWRSNVAWDRVAPALRDMRDECEARGARFFVVYLPTKAHVLLPHLEHDPGLLHRYASHDLPQPLAGDPGALAERLLANAGNLERLVLELCAAEGIPALSAHPALTAQAAAGELGYLVTDTHWQPAGQRALLTPLLDFLEREGVLASD